ncbi:MAG TPA: heavy-metal-associated domain-containing protein [Ktedonobacterales bacterium]
MADTTETREVTLSVPEVSCEHCVHTIGEALGNLAGISDVQTDIPSKTVQVHFNPEEVSLDSIVAKLDDVGYEVAGVGEVHEARQQ